MTLPDNPMGEFFERLGQRVARSASSCWHEVQPRVFLAFPYCQPIEPEEAEIQSLIRQYRLHAVRYTTPLTAFGFFSTVEINMDAEYDISKINKRTVRQAIRRGLENFTVEQIDAERLRAEGLALNKDTAERQCRRTIYTDPGYWQRYCQAVAETPGVTVWGAMRRGQLASYVVTAQYDGWSNWMLAHSLNSLLHLRPNNALYYITSKYFLVDPGGYKICHGLGSLEDVHELDRFKRGMGITFQPIKQRLEFSLPIRAAITLAPRPVLKCLSALVPKSYTVRKTVAMFQLYRQQTAQSLDPSCQLHSSLGSEGVCP